MNIASLEAFLAKLYTDAAYRRAFVDRPAEILASTALTAEEQAACMAINRQQLAAAARSYEAKRAARAAPAPHSKLCFLRAWLRRCLRARL